MLFLLSHFPTKVRKLWLVLGWSFRGIVRALEGVRVGLRGLLSLAYVLGEDLE